MFLPVETPILLKQLIKTWKSIEFLNGNLSKISKFDFENFNKLMFLKSLKFGFQLENINFSHNKIWDHVLLEKKNDKQLNIIKWTFLKWQKEMLMKWQNISVSNKFELNRNDFLKPLFLKENLTEKEIVYIQKLNKFQNEIDKEPEIDSLLYGLYLSSKCFELSPFLNYNYLSSLNFMSMWMKYEELSFLPNFNSFELVFQNFKDSLKLQNEYESNQISQNYFLFHLQLIEESAFNYQKKLNKYLDYKEWLNSSIEKYGSKKMLLFNLSEIIISNPLLSKKKIIELTQCHRHSASHYLDFLEKNGFSISYLSQKERITFNKDLFNLIINEE